MNTRIKKVKKGFTLLEILLVIAAIGILAAIVLVAINPNRQIAQVRDAQRRSDINTIYKALEQYLIDNKDYPIGIGNIAAPICNTGTEQSGSTATDCSGKVDLRVLVPIYLAAIPKDPSGLVYNVYKNPANNRIGVEAPGVELSQSLVVNPTPADLIQAQITAGTLVPTGTQQLVLGQLVYKNNAGTQTYIDRAATTRTCPTGYIAVPGNSMYGTTDFCVMKYEAKAVEISNPTVGLLTPTTGFNTIANNTTATTSANGRAIASVASGYPIANISQITAIDYCANQNTVSGASLISNTEWMTIARNIEGQASNWTGGAVGSGGLWRGHSDNSPVNGLAANTNDSQGYEGTGNANETPVSKERRTHTLSNGETIWDLSGNVWEWTSDTIMGVDKPTGGSEFTAMTGYGTLSYDLIRPSNPAWNSTQNMGRYFVESLTGGPFAFRRGAGWGSAPDATAAGVFTLRLDSAPTLAVNGAIGFRCVLR